MFPTDPSTNPTPTPAVDTLAEGPPSGTPPTAPTAAPAELPKRPRRRSARRAVAAAAVVLVIGAGAGAGAIAGAVTNHDTVSTASPSATKLAAAPAVDDVSNLVAAALPSVVNVQVSSSTAQAAGSGFVLTADGAIVTNAHVVDGFSSITVTLNDNSTHSATVLGIDRTDDLAVIHIDATNLVPVALGSSGNLKVGQPVVALGNALALTGGPSATEGIVSGVGRSITTDDGESLTHLVQTDAAINPGNSGGPLLALDGTVVGINSVGATGAQNVGFAIAIDEAKPIIAQLANGQTVSAPFLGVTSGPLDATLAGQQGLSVDHGLLVVSVEANSPAAAAGLAAGDVILSANGTATNAPEDLHTIIQNVGAGQPLQLSVARGTQTLTLTATVGSRTA